MILISLKKTGPVFNRHSLSFLLYQRFVSGLPSFLSGTSLLFTIYHTLNSSLTTGLATSRRSSDWLTPLT